MQKMHKMHKLLRTSGIAQKCSPKHPEVARSRHKAYSQSEGFGNAVKHGSPVAASVESFGRVAVGAALVRRRPRLAMPLDTGPGG